MLQPNDLRVLRMKVRERRAPRARAKVGLQGWLRWSLLDRNGKEIRGGEQSNLILNQGLDQVASNIILVQTSVNPAPNNVHFPIIRYAAVGTDNTAPAIEQTVLGNEIARTGFHYTADTLLRTGNGIYELTRSIEFDYDEGNGNLTEWGFSFSDSSGNLFNRELFRNDEGDPDPVTKTEDNKLRLIYTLEVNLSPVIYTPASFDITGVGTVNGNYMLVGGDLVSSVSGHGTAPDLKVFNYLAALGNVNWVSANNPAVGSLCTTDADRSSVVYADAVDPGTHSGSTPAFSTNTFEEERDAYVPGSFERTGGLWRFETNQGNENPVRAIEICGASGNTAGGITSTRRIGYIFSIDNADQFVKDDEHVLFIGVPEVTWGRV